MTATKKEWQSGDPPERMAKLYLGLLKKGPAWSPESTAQVRADQRGHQANLSRMQKSGILLIAGPVLNAGALRGIVICQAENAEAIELAFAGDPHMQSGRLILELFPWLVDADVLGAPLVTEVRYLWG